MDSQYTTADKITIKEATASLQRRLRRFGPAGSKREFYYWKNNNIIRSWDRGSRYLHGAPTDVTPSLVFTIYLYRHYINDAGTFHDITRIYEQITDEHFYEASMGRADRNSMASYLVNPTTFCPSAYETACKAAFLIRGREPNNLLTGSHGADGDRLRIESHSHDEAVEVAKRLAQYTTHGSRKRTRSGGLIDFVIKSRNSLESLSVEQICCALGFSSTSSFIFYQNFTRCASTLP